MSTQPQLFRCPLETISAKTILAALCLAPLTTPGPLAAADLQVLPPSADGTTPSRIFEEWILHRFHELVQQRRDAFEKMLKSEAACRQWQEDRKTFFLDAIGGLPERTPLNPRVTGTLQGDGYRVENIILETRPSFHLTANLYLPDSPGPWPGVLVACGHSHDGKAAGQYQLACRLLARHGMAAICYDPIGQGERYQILDSHQPRTVFEDAPHVPTPHPFVKLLCTTEHTMVGLGSALLGSNVAQFRIWDGMRVIDYLQSRPGIIPGKIGCTGNSGGGTETAYLMALDDRILAAAPGCYLMTFQKLIETRGPQDGEQNIFGQIAFGMDQADYCIMRAPLPTLIAAGTRDVTFHFDGTWDLFRDAKRFYSRLGHPDLIDLAAPDAPHGFTLQLREAVTRFMARHLLGKDISVREVDILPDSFDDTELRTFSQPDWTAAQLQCTPDGQVLLLPGERSAFQINTETAARLKATRNPIWSRLSEAEKEDVIRQVIGSGSATGPDVELTGQIDQEHCIIHKLLLSTASKLQLPALAFVPRNPSGSAVLYLHGDSMKEDASPGGPIETLVREGHLVLAAELRGLGETATGFTRRAFGGGRFGRENLEVLTAYLMGLNYTGMRTEDALSWARYLASPALTGSAPREIHLVAFGKAAVPALHAAALERETFHSVTLHRMIPTWESLVSAGETFDQTVHMVHGVLQHYDLPDLVDFAGSDKVTVIDPVDPLGRVIGSRQ